MNTQNKTISEAELTDEISKKINELCNLVKKEALENILFSRDLQEEPQHIDKHDNIIEAKNNIRFKIKKQLKEKIEFLKKE